MLECQLPAYAALSTASLRAREYASTHSMVGPFAIMRADRYQTGATSQPGVAWATDGRRLSLAFEALLAFTAECSLLGHSLYHRTLLIPIVHVKLTDFSQSLPSCRS